jgi:hypothetical protein
MQHHPPMAQSGLRLSSEARRLLYLTAPIMPDSAKAADWLLRLPGEFLTLSALLVDRTTKEGGTFETQAFGHPVDRALLVKWIDARQGKANIYYALNPLLRSMKKKAGRVDVKEARWLHVDLDPRAGEPVEEEQARIFRQLGQYPLRPHVVIFSGGGYQALWMLEQAIAIDGDVANVAEKIEIELLIERRIDRVRRADKEKRKRAQPASSDECDRRGDGVEHHPDLSAERIYYAQAH